MTLEELENTPPHGLHDAEVQRSAVDYEHRKVMFALAVWVGDMDDPPERREVYKSGCLEITGLISLVMEPHDARYAFRISSNLKIDGQCVGEPVNAFMHIGNEHAKRTALNDSAVTYRTPQELKG